MSDILGRIDSTLDGLCPSGAEPAPGSPYCSHDCTPTHIGPDTDTTWNRLPADLDDERALAVRRIAGMFDVPPALLLEPDAAPAPARGMPLTEVERLCLERLSDGEEAYLWVEPADGLPPRRVHARRRSSRRGSIIDLRLVDDPRPELLA